MLFSFQSLTAGIPGYHERSCSNSMWRYMIIIVHAMFKKSGSSISSNMVMKLLHTRSASVYRKATLVCV